MKRTLSILLSALLLLSSVSLASCGKRDAVDITGITSIADLETVDGVVLAAQTGTFHLDALKAQVSANVKKLDYKDFPTLLTALNAGAIDGYVAEEPTAIAMVQQDTTLTFVALRNNDTGFTAADSDAGVAVAFVTGSPLVAEANAILAGISGETRTALMTQACAMAANKDAPLGENIVLASEKTGTGNGILAVSMECAYDPFNWTQDKDVNGAVPIYLADKTTKTGLYANGYDVQVAKYLAAEMGKELRIVSNEWDSLIPAVKSGAVDAIIAGMSPTEEREEEVDFTDCYYTSNLVIITKKSAE